MKKLSIAVLLLLMMGFWNFAHAVVTSLPLVNNGVVITDPNQIVDVEYNGNGAGGWIVSVGNGLNIEQFFFNYDTPIGLGDISINTADWSLVTAGGGGGTAGNFGQFSVNLDGPVPGGSSLLEFEVIAAGLFIPNGKGNIFAAKISSEAGGNAGGFISENTSVSQVPLPTTVWMFLSALAGLAVFSVWSRRRKQLIDVCEPTFFRQKIAK